jgi:basic membrane protein A
MIKRVDNAVYDIVKEVVDGKFKGGFHVFGLESDGVGYVIDQYNRDIVSPEALRAVEEARKKIIAGEIKVTDAMAQ